MEVAPDDDCRHGQLRDEDARDEVLGRLCRSFLVEPDDLDLVDAGGFKELKLLVEVGEKGRCRLRPHDGGRVAIEGDDDGGEPTRPGACGKITQQRPMPQVHAVVGADGDGSSGHRG